MARPRVASFAGAGFVYGLTLLLAASALLGGKAWFPGAVFSAPFSLLLGIAAPFLAPALWAALFAAAAAAGRRAFVAAAVLVALQNLSAAPIWLAFVQTVAATRAEGQGPGLLSARHLFLLLLTYAGQAAFLIASRRASRD